MALPVCDFLAEEHRRQSVDIREATGSEQQVRRAHWYWCCHKIQSGESDKGRCATPGSCMQSVNVKGAAVLVQEGSAGA